MTGGTLGPLVSVRRKRRKGGFYSAGLGFEPGTDGCGSEDLNHWADSVLVVDADSGTT